MIIELFNKLGGTIKMFSFVSNVTEPSPGEKPY